MCIKRCSVLVHNSDGISGRDFSSSHRVETDDYIYHTHNVKTTTKWQL